MDIAQSIIQTAAILNQLSEEEFSRLMKEAEKIYKSKKKQKTTISIKVTLDDAESKDFQLVQLMMGKEVTSESLTQTAFSDGVTINAHVFLSALNLVIASKGMEEEENTEDIEDDVPE